MSNDIFFEDDFAAPIMVSAAVAPPMSFTEYQDKARVTRTCFDMAYPVLKLTGEAGEVSEKYGKALRDDDGDPFIDPWTKPQFRLDIEKELGDVLWYIAAIADDLGLSLEGIARRNIAKLADRKARGVIGGSGDNR